MFEKLEEYIKEYNLRHRDEGGCIMLKRYSAEHIEPLTDDEEPALPREKKLKLQKRKIEESLTVAICTPLMARIHQGIPQAGELMYVDSTASIDRYNLSMFLLSTGHVGGGLPLGVMICSDESTSTVQECLLQYKAIIPKAAFYNQTSEGPKVIMTDDSEAQRQALTATWPKSVNLLCVFHVLQSFWTWLHESKNNIRKEHRQPLMGKMKELVYAETEQVLNTKYQELTSDKVVISYPKFLQHVKNYWLRRQKWAICLRKDLMIRRNNTNNYAEAGIKILKELVFGKVKAYNLIEMVSFVIDVMEAYYQRRLIHLANNRVDRFIALRFCGLKYSTVPAETICKGEDHLFYVNSRQERGLVYTVDMQLGLCTCKQGVGGAPCSHQAAVSKHYHLHSINSVINLFPEKRKELATIALGSKAEQEIGYYASLHQKADESIIHDIPPEGNDSNPDFFDNAWKVVKEDAKDQDDKDVTTTPQPAKDSANVIAISHNLITIMKDLQQRFEKDTSGQLKQGVEKFCQRYQQITMLKFSNNRIASALNRFGWVFGGNITNVQGGILRRGRRIAVQATAAGRRRKTLSRRKAKVTAGRPVKNEAMTQRTQGDENISYYIPPRNLKPPKRLHSLTTNVALSQQNARKW